MTIVTIRRIELPLAGFVVLASKASREGHDFLVRADKEWRTGIARFDRDGESLLGAFEGEQIVGMAGLNKDPYTTDPAVGRLRHVYVLPEQRRHGIAAALIRQTLALAGSRFSVVRLRSRNPAASALYERLGFRPLEDVCQSTHALTLHGSG